MTTSGRRRRDPVATRERIVASATSAFLEGGPAAVTVSDVAHRAGVNRGTAYHHFRTRDELLAAVTASLSTEMEDGIEEILELESVDERFDAFAEYFARNPNVARYWLLQLLSPFPLPGGDRSAMRALEKAIEGMRALAGDSRSHDGIDPEALAVAVISGVLVWAIRTDVEGGSDAAKLRVMRRYAQEQKRLMVRGVFRAGAFPDLERSLGMHGRRRAAG